MLTSAAMLAPDGRCKTLDAAADGWAPRTGAACIKPSPAQACLHAPTGVIQMPR